MTPTGTTEAASFRASIIARRPLLQYLFETTLHNLTFVQGQAVGSEEVTAAQWMSQDCANALVVILDYALSRFLVTAKLIRANDGRRKLQEALSVRGPEAYGSVRLGQAIATLADVARHLSEFQADEPPSDFNQEVLDSLGLSQKHDQAAAQFLQNLRKQSSAFASYDAFECGLLAIAS